MSAATLIGFGLLYGVGYVVAVLLFYRWALRALGQYHVLLPSRTRQMIEADRRFCLWFTVVFQVLWPVTLPIMYVMTRVDEER